MIKVDKNIPIPETTKGRRNSYPWHEMKIGDSFFVELPEGKKANQMQSILLGNSRRHGKFVSRITKENGIEGVRIWKTQNLVTQ